MEKSSPLVEPTGERQGATSSSFRWGEIFYEISFDDVIVLIQPWYKFFAHGHR